MSRYAQGRLIGSGTYAKVYEAYDTETKKVVAMKKIELNEKEGMPSTALREISILKSISHRNIIELFQIIHKEDILILIFEFVEFDLLKYIEIHGNTLSLIQQLIVGIQYLHSRNIIHRDLKPSNILITKDGVLKIADFGLARTISPMDFSYSSEVVTLWYRAPELLMGSLNYLYEIDIWSLGCIIYEIVTLKPLLPGENKQSQLALCRCLNYKKIVTELTISYNIPPFIADIVCRCLESIPKKRITITEIVHLMEHNLGAAWSV